MARFTLPRDLYHGKGALEALKTFKGKKAIICVGGGSMKRFGFLDKAEQYLAVGSVCTDHGICGVRFGVVYYRKRGDDIQLVSGAAEIHAVRRCNRRFYHVYGNSGDESMRAGKSRYVYCYGAADRCLSD